MWFAARRALKQFSCFCASNCSARTTFSCSRGNHECAPINAFYGFQAECKRRFPNQWRTIWNAFNICFTLHPPLVALVVVGERMLCTHGGISTKLNSKQDLAKLRRGWIEPKAGSLDLIWADPNSGGSGWNPNDRGCSYTFGDDVLTDCCRKLKVDIIVRGHQCVLDGYELSPTGRLVTIFSAPHYEKANNNAAIIFVSRDLAISFIVLPADHKNVMIYFEID